MKHHSLVSFDSRIARGISAPGNLLSPDVCFEQNIHMETATTNFRARVHQGLNLKPPIHPAVWHLLL